MARGKRTDPAQAVLVKVMAEMGFDPGMIAEITRLPRGTVNDIIRGHGRWRETPQSELYEITKQRVRRAIESVADDLAMKAIARPEEKIKKALMMEGPIIFEALSRKGRLLDEPR